MHCYGPTHPYNCHCNPKHCRKIFDTALSLPSDAAGCQCEGSVGTYMSKITAIHCTQSLLWVPCSPTIPCFPAGVFISYLFDTALKCRGGAGCTSVQGAPCWSDNTLLSGTFRPSASSSGSPAPSYIHLLHFQREKRLKKSEGK